MPALFAQLADFLGAGDEEHCDALTQLRPFGGRRGGVIEAVTDFDQQPHLFG